jgi:hypothetical protein
MQEIKISLAIEEVDLILEALGNLPFAKVYALIGKIQEQAARQIEAANAAEAKAAPAPGETPKAQK